VKAKSAGFTPEPGFKSGYAMLLGRPNVGKSTLLNAIMGQELAIVTPKPQTTRSRIRGIHTTGDHQIIFLDAPGVVDAEKGLNAYLKREVQAALKEADVIVLVVEAFGSPKASDREIIERLKKLSRPVVLAINKVDKVAKSTLLPLIAECQTLFPFAAIVPVSAKTGDGANRIVAETAAALAEGPMYYPADQVTDATERFLVGELIREQVFRQTKQELPYSSAVLVESFHDDGRLVKIGAQLFVEREGQKGIVIGREGAMLKAIGSAARAKIELFLGRKIYLDLQVKVKKDWTRSPGLLAEMGYAT
jgi:GTP-binding protein Era